MNITVVWIIIAICTITFCIGLFKAASDIEKDLAKEKFFDTNMRLEDVERRLDEMEQYVENLIVRDDIPVHEEKDDEYYDGLLEWMDDNKEEQNYGRIFKRTNNRIHTKPWITRFYEKSNGFL